METVSKQFARLNREGWPCAYSGDRGHWLIVYGQHRDSDTVTRANFQGILEALEAIVPDSVAVESASHWAVGWVESLLIDPTCQAVVDEAQAILDALGDYPVVDDEALSQLEHDETMDAWDSWGAGDFVRELVKLHGDIVETKLDEMDNDTLWCMFQDAGGEYFMESGGPYFRIREAARRVSLRDILGMPVAKFDMIHGDYRGMVADAERWASDLGYIASSSEWALDRMEALQTWAEGNDLLIVEHDDAVEVYTC